MARVHDRELGDHFRGGNGFLCVFQVRILCGQDPVEDLLDHRKAALGDFPAEVQGPVILETSRSPGTHLTLPLFNRTHAVDSALSAVWPIPLGYRSENSPRRNKGEAPLRCRQPRNRAPQAYRRRPLFALFVGPRILQDALGDQPGILPDRSFDLRGDFGILAQELLGILASLPDALAVEREPCA